MKYEKGACRARESSTLINEHLAMVNLTAAAASIQMRPTGGGPKQRAGACWSWLFALKMLLMDEPFGASTPRRKLRQQVLDIWETTHRQAVMMITHDAG